MLNIDDLNNTLKEKEDKQNKIYDEILKKCHHKIKKTSETSTEGFCFYVIPEYIYGFPLYNYKGCVIYLFKTLTKNGFEVKYTHPNLLFISWIGKSNPQNYKTIEKKNNGYRSIEEYKPSGNIIYNKTINSLSNKLDILKN
jgi:hypothetical protein|tara:strand:+ start:101 stop:523 length:423 start_codon:yes stop_codon:yes gene_type:complete